ncbi:hypothetical protein BDQ94DRAFT_184943 [Aspergillus welwitschiae]|uniref:Uncharacterized protein n=1 Tax=Aspergillus welwitschiae TaxID=1341132 RepID=A0A3F3PKR3_9EURO|nr:hypothetical protein BDQ94DRAFT_184943 [Aspergillus welwitschiae]RDH27362.1 hypothetical protein BDQ94DRAFT_184943 [Aspergillus welwitschiae]
MMPSGPKVPGGQECAIGEAKKPGRDRDMAFQGPTGPERTDWPTRDRLQSQTVRSPILSWLVASQHPYLPLIPPPPAAIIIFSLPSVLFRVRRQRGRESSLLVIFLL